MNIKLSQEGMWTFPLARVTFMKTTQPLEQPSAHENNKTHDWHLQKKKAALPSWSSFSILHDFSCRFHMVL